MKEFFIEAIFTACLVVPLTILIKLHRCSAVPSLKKQFKETFSVLPPNIRTVNFEYDCIQINFLAMESNNKSHKLFAVHAVNFSFSRQTKFPLTFLKILLSTEDKQRY